MPAWLIELFKVLIFALGDKVFTEGTEFYKEWSALKEAKKRADKYEKVIKDPNSSLEDRLRAEDELGS